MVESINYFSLARQKDAGDHSDIKLPEPKDERPDVIPLTERSDHSASLSQLQFRLCTENDVTLVGVFYREVIRF